jgi:hypothetical protein
MECQSQSKTANKYENPTNPTNGRNDAARTHIERKLLDVRPAHRLSDSQRRAESSTRQILFRRQYSCRMHARRQEQALRHGSGRDCIGYCCRRKANTARRLLLCRSELERWRTMKKVNASQYEFSALPFNLAGQEAIDGAAEQARLDAEAQAIAENEARQSDMPF